MLGAVAGGGEKASSTKKEKRRNVEAESDDLNVENRAYLKKVHVVDHEESAVPTAGTGEGAEGEKDDEASVASAGSSHRGAVVGLNDGRPFPEEGGEGGDYVDRSGEEADAAGSTSNEEDVEGSHCDLASDADPARDADADADPPEDDGN